MRMARRRNSCGSVGMLCVCRSNMICKRCSILRKEAVVFLQQRTLLMRQAAGIFQLRNRFQRVAGAQLRHVAAVEQLQELDHELDIADASLAGLHVRGVFALRERTMLDAALERLDARDVGQGQVATIDPGFEIAKKLFAQVQIAGHGPAP